MSSRSFIRIPLQIPPSLQDKPFKVTFSVEMLDSEGNYDDSMAIFLDKELHSNDLQDTSQAGQKVALLERSAIKKFSAERHGQRPIGLKVCWVPWFMANDELVLTRERCISGRVQRW
jgi:hypothetical protein